MKRYIKAIVVVLLFVVLVDPIKVGASQPPEVYPVGIVIDVDVCDEGEVLMSTYIIDIVVQKDEVEDIMITPTATYRYPDALLDSAYGDRENEWISAILYLDEAEWDNRDCRTMFYSYLFYADELPFSQYKVVVYEEGQDPVESATYNSSESAMYDAPEGFKTVYNPVDKTFDRVFYEAEVYGGINGPWNGLVILIVGLFTLLISVFVLMESFIALLARQGWRVVFITLGLNLLALGYVVSQLIEPFRMSEELYGIIGILLIPNFYVLKILLLKRHGEAMYKVSIVLSSIYYFLFFLFFIQSMM